MCVLITLTTNDTLTWGPNCVTWVKLVMLVVLSYDTCSGDVILLKIIKYILAIKK